ncbi:histidine phosphatase family protein [Stieleria varia]|uniref:Phosphoglycerate mutase n=1 Tax=Stieleria varia TaxID=2528005 RepID=A0A5C6B3R9_9BACT|nr:histidine phosphatase family protein [Stieleria varia]TWU06407.1 phosphoglycerate mutase [Stieleria varia]
MQLYLIRHAESGNNAVPTYQRSEDPSITSVGRLQAEHLGNWIKTLRFDAMITSPFRRTLETTRTVLQANSKPSDVRIWDSVFERGGCYRGWNASNVAGARGMGRSEILNELSDVVGTLTIDETIGETGWWGEQPRETDDAAIERTGIVAERLVREFGGDGKGSSENGQSPVIVMVTHADFKRLLLSRLLDSKADAMRFGPLRNTGVTRLNYAKNQWQLDILNSVTHLPARLITGNEH